MTGNRDKISAEEIPPVYELFDLRHQGQPFQICWNFQEKTHAGMEGEPERTSFDYSYVNVPNLNLNTVQAAGVPQEVIDQIEEVIIEPELNDTEALNILLGQ